MSAPTPPRPPRAPELGGSSQRWRLNLGPEAEDARRVLPAWEDGSQWAVDTSGDLAPPVLEGETTNLNNPPPGQAEIAPSLNEAEVAPGLDPEATAINLAAMSPSSAHPANFVEDPEATAIRVGAGSGANLIDDAETTAIRVRAGDSTNLNNDPETVERVYAELVPLEIDPVHLSIDPDTTQLNIAGEDDALEGYVFQARPLPQPSGTWDPLSVPELKSNADTWSPKPDEERYEAPPEAPPPRRRPARRRVVTFVVAIVVLAVAAGVAISAYLQRVTNDPQTKPPVPTGAPSSATGTTGGEVVTSYLEALSKGDIVTALSLGPTGPGSKALISADAYPAVWRTGKIADIEVSKTDPTATEIPVTYTLNGKPVNTVMRVERQQDGSFTLAKSTVTVQISGNGDGVAQVPLLIDTRPVGWNRSYELVPGVYQASTGLPFLAFTSDSTLVVNDLAKQDTWTLAPQVSEKGQEAFLAAATESLNTCYERKELSPPNCPFAEVAKQQVRPETIKRVPTADPLAGEKITLLANDLRQGQVQVVLTYTWSVTYTSGATSGAKSISHPAVLTMNLAVANADLLKPEWKSA